MKIYVELDLSEAKSIHLDFINSDGTACLYAEYSNGSKYYRITLEQLNLMLEVASFKWLDDKTSQVTTIGGPI